MKVFFVKLQTSLLANFRVFLQRRHVQDPDPEYAGYYQGAVLCDQQQHVQVYTSLTTFRTTQPGILSRFSLNAWPGFQASIFPKRKCAKKNS